MYPQPVFLGITLYDIFICVGIITCFIVFGYLADKAKLIVKLQNMMLLCATASIALGFGSAILFQALYNIESSGRFEIVQSTGATFYGGLIGGVAAFMLLYFGVGSLVFKKTDRNYHKSSFFTAIGCATPSVAVAHGFGRLGCLSAGCCHGAPTDAWYGIMMYGDMGYGKYVPVQLFEACFLFLLFGTLFFRARAGKRYNLPIYMAAYGVWRFFIEFARRDFRGSIGFTSLTPSQFISVIMLAVAIVLFFTEKSICNKKTSFPQADIASVSKNEIE